METSRPAKHAQEPRQSLDPEAESRPRSSSGSIDSAQVPPDGSRTRTVHWEDPNVAAAAGREMSGLAYLQAIAAGELPTPPIAALLGMRLRSVEEGRVVFEMDSAEHLYNPIGLIHGGAIATLVDSVAGCAIHTMLPAGAGYATTALMLSYVRPATTDSGLITATGHVVRVGRTTAYASAEAVDAQGRLLATTQVTCAIIR